MESISIYIPGLILTYVAFLLTVLSPGPNVLAVMGTSMAINRRAGLSVGMGVATGTVFWSSFSVLGLSQLISSYAFVLVIIKWFGGLFLLWLAFKAFRSAGSAQDPEATDINGKSRSYSSLYVRGFLINISNPKAAFAWIAIVSLGLTEGAPWWVGAAIVGGTVTLSVLCHAIYALIFSTAPLVSVYKAARRWIQGLLGVFFTYAGVRILGSSN